MWFDQADVQDLTLLAQYDVWGGVPKEPLKLPGLGRYGRFEFDRHSLLQRNGMTVAQRREVIFLSAHFHRIDHFEFFELAPDANVRALKKAFFHFSKRFHPDVVGAIQLGALGEHVKLVFEYGQAIHNLLAHDDPFREAYSRVTRARNEAFMAALRHEREQRAHEVQEARSRGVKPPIDIRIGGAPTPIPPQGTPPSIAETEARKAKLRERLSHNKTRRREAEGARQSADLKSQARTFFLAGEQAERRGQLERALNHYKLCVDYLPQKNKYVQAHKRVRSALREREASGIWAEAETMTRSGDELQTQAAFDLYLKACQLSPNERRLITLSQLALESERAGEVIDELKKATLTEPLNLDLKWSLAQCYEAQRDLTQARQYVDEMLSYDPAEPRALRFQKRYR